MTLERWYLYYMSNIYSYMRVSTSEERGLQKFTRQENALHKYAQSNNFEYILEFKEDKSGKNFEERKQWNKLERIIQPGDTIVFKDICRFTREAEAGYKKYMELLNKDIELVFLDNQTISTSYIRQLLNVAKEQENLVAKITLESIVKLLLIVELDRAEQERLTTIKRIKDGIAASDKKSGRPVGKLDKITDSLKTDIKMFLQDRSIKQVDLMKKHHISRNTLKKYIKLVQNGNI